MNVHRIGDGSIVGEPDEFLVSRLEELLASAKAGDIIGIAYACNTSDNGMVQYGWTPNISHSQIGSLHVVAHLMARDMAD